MYESGSSISRGGAACPYQLELLLDDERRRPGAETRVDVRCGMDVVGRRDDRRLWLGSPTPRQVVPNGRRVRRRSDGRSDGGIARGSLFATHHASRDVRVAARRRLERSNGNGRGRPSAQRGSEKHEIEQQYEGWHIFARLASCRVPFSTGQISAALMAMSLRSGVPGTIDIDPGTRARDRTGGGREVGARSSNE